LPNISEPLFTASEISSTMHNPTSISQAFVGYAGAVVITVGGARATRCYSKKATKSIPLFRKIFKDTAFNKFRIYPNPIKSNSTLTIELNQEQYGDHLLQLFNQTEQLILSKDIYIDEKARLFTMTMPSIISGN
jgi:hypothetical protein